MNFFTVFSFFFLCCVASVSSSRKCIFSNGTSTTSNVDCTSEYCTIVYAAININGIETNAGPLQACGEALNDTAFPPSLVGLQNCENYGKEGLQKYDKGGNLIEIYCCKTDLCNTVDQVTILPTEAITTKTAATPPATNSSRKCIALDGSSAECTSKYCYSSVTESDGGKKNSSISHGCGEDLTDTNMALIGLKTCEAYGKEGTQVNDIGVNVIVLKCCSTDLCNFDSSITSTQIPTTTTTPNSSEKNLFGTNIIIFFFFLYKFF